MISAILLAATTQGAPINLYRGASLAVPRYWAVEDTFLDAASPDENFGGSYTLSGGKGRTILIKFGDLNRIVGPHRHVTSAVLYLTPIGGEPPVLKSVGRVLQSWGQGPRTVIAKLYEPPKPGAKPVPLHWAATYKARKAGIASWQTGGAAGPEDRELIKGAHLDSRGTEVSISGLEGDVQFMLDHPEQNHGFALDFLTSTQFNSSKSPSGTPRLEIVTEPGPADSGADLSVVSINSEPVSPHNGEEVTYTATVRNVGTAGSQGFSGQWIINEKASTSADKKQSIAPGEAVTTTFQHRFEETATDHRVGTVGFRIEPVGADNTTTNNQLTIFEAGVPVTVNISPSLLSRNEQNYLGSQSWEDWAQGQVELWNDTVAAQSCFSFAPEGALQRIRINGFAAQGGGLSIPNTASPNQASVPFLKELSLAAGCLDGSAMQIPASKIAISGSTSRSGLDLFPGITDYGDTRFEGGIPGLLPMEYESVYDPQQVGNYLPATDLLPSNDVLGMNRHLASRPPKPSDILLPVPAAVILRVLDMQGNPLPDTDLLFFQSSGGGVPAGNPAFAVKTNEKGLAILNSRGSAGPFGDLTPSGDNGAFLVQAKTNGVLETTWLKAWQLSEATARGAFTVNMRLNLPGAPVDRSTNLSLDKTVTDSAGSAATVLAPLIDDSEETSVDLPQDPGSWVEVDLGRDRFLDEVDLVATGKPFWQQFDVVTYGTGQKAQEGSLLARELNWGWTSVVRRDAAKSPDRFVVAYRGVPERVRYIRLVNKSGGAGNLAEIRIFPARVNN